MKFQYNGIYPLIKIKTPPEINFFSAHKRCIDENGFVWFCRFGKNNMKIVSLEACKHLLLIKESGIKKGGVYIAEYVELATELNDSETSIPAYYEDLQQSPSFWIKLISLVPLDFDVFTTSFVVNSSNGSVENILRSMCPASFLRCISTKNLV